MIVSLLVVLPATAAAQKDVFVDAFIALHSALPGTDGDEGGQIESEFARMTAAFAAWERSGAAAEAALKKRGATPGEFALHYIEQQQLDSALTAINSAIADEPNRTSLYLYQGQLLEAVGRSVDARAAFAKARQLDPDDPLAAYFVATRSFSDTRPELEPSVATLLAAGGRRRAIAERPFADLALIRDLSSTVPAFAPAAYVGAFTAFREGRFRDALEQFRASIARDPLIADSASRLPSLKAGVAALRARNDTEAIAQLEVTVKSSPESSESHRALGNAFRAIGKLTESIAQFELAVRLRPDDERARVALGTALAEAGRLEDAERELQNTIRTMPASGAARWELATLLEKQSRGTEAIRVLEDALPLPIVAGRTRLLWRIATTAHAYLRDVDRVIAMATQVVALVPNDSGGHKDLGLAYYRAGRDNEAAVELLMATLLGHQDGELLGALGEIHLNADRLEQAAAVLFRAVALDPTRMQARYVLARTLQRLGRSDEAKEQLAAFEKLRVKEHDEQLQKFVKDKGPGE